MENHARPLRLVKDYSVLPDINFCMGFRLKKIALIILKRGGS